MSQSSRPRRLLLPLAAASLVAVTGVATGAALRSSGTAHAAVHGGCEPYQVDGFAIDVCISDRGTGTTAYPEIRVNQTGFIVGPCSIDIELWGGGRLYGLPAHADCGLGPHEGNSFGPVIAPVSVHAFARLRTNFISYYLGDGRGDSPTLSLQPYVVTTPQPTASPSTTPKPIPPIPPRPGGSQQNNRPSCLRQRPAQAQPNGAGWILNTTSTVPNNNLTPTPSGVPGIRAEQAQACLVEPPRAVPPAMKNTNINITGDQDARARAAAAGSQTPGRDVQNCHLIGDQLGGYAIPENLVPCWQTVNTGRNAMSGFEGRVRGALLGATPGTTIFYTVTPNYTGRPSTVPRSITITAVLQSPNPLMAPEQPLFPPVTLNNEQMIGGQTINLGN